jgi:hypothetical protein
VLRGPLVQGQLMTFMEDHFDENEHYSFTVVQTCVPAPGCTRGDALCLHVGAPNCM